MFRHGRRVDCSICCKVSVVLDGRLRRGKTPLAVMLERGSHRRARWIVVAPRTNSGRRSRPPRKRTAIPHRALPAQQPTIFGTGRCRCKQLRDLGFNVCLGDRQSREQLFAQPFRRNANCA